ncbi:MAG: hypothetical protein QOI96_990, partial [Verrucomicrobiota bacterium]
MRFLPIFHRFRAKVMVKATGFRFRSEKAMTALGVRCQILFFVRSSPGRRKAKVKGSRRVSFDPSFAGRFSPEIGSPSFPDPFVPLVDFAIVFDLEIAVVGFAAVLAHLAADLLKRFVAFDPVGPGYSFRPSS